MTVLRRHPLSILVVLAATLLTLGVFAFARPAPAAIRQAFAAKPDDDERLLEHVKAAVGSLH